MKYGEKIRELRERFGLSQRDLAQKLGVHKQMISDVERGKQKRFNPYIEHRLIEIFNLDPKWLLEEDEPQEVIVEQQEEKQDDEELLRAQELMLLKYFEEIPPQKRLKAMACLLDCISQFRS